MNVTELEWFGALLSTTPTLHKVGWALRTLLQLDGRCAEGERGRASGTGLVFCLRVEAVRTVLGAVLNNSTWGRSDQAGPYSFRFVFI